MENPLISIVMVNYNHDDFLNEGYFDDSLLMFPIAKSTELFFLDKTLYERFSDKKDYFINNVSFGGGCVNDTIMHITSPNLPFGGVGESGLGAYHGKRGFDTFSHYKSILEKSTKIDLALRYRPYNKFKIKSIKNFFKT